MLCFLPKPEKAFQAKMSGPQALVITIVLLWFTHFIAINL